MSTSWIGFVGTLVVIVAYLPQIAHLVKAQCSAGISLKAYALWIISSLLLLLHAFNLNDAVFIALQSYQLGATMTIVAFAWKYKTSTCELHQRQSSAVSF
ncbi:MAG TPA: PQ-loop domain-containing transporter [Candidatus Binatia bacterium]|nr:PQ-loop domain-containing transporter [Candidatus Binatia bacterium]